MVSSTANKFRQEARDGRRNAAILLDVGFEIGPDDATTAGITGATTADAEYGF